MQNTIKVNIFTHHADVDPVHTATVYTVHELSPTTAEKRRLVFCFVHKQFPTSEKEDFLCVQKLSPRRDEKGKPVPLCVQKLSPRTAEKGKPVPLCVHCSEIISSDSKKGRPVPLCVHCSEIISYDSKKGRPVPLDLLVNSYLYKLLILSSVAGQNYSDSVPASFKNFYHVPMFVLETFSVLKTESDPTLSY